MSDELISRIVIAARRPRPDHRAGCEPALLSEVTMNARVLVALPNVSTSCPPGQCNAGAGCFPCETDHVGLPPTPVPTLSEWGTIVLICILGIIGLCGKPKP